MGGLPRSDLDHQATAAGGAPLLLRMEYGTRAAEHRHVFALSDGHAADGAQDPLCVVGLQQGPHQDDLRMIKRRDEVRWLPIERRGEGQRTGKKGEF